MNTFLIWIGILFLGIAVFFVILMKSDKRGFRFQTRLTILFLLLTLAPSVPLILLSIELINQGIEKTTMIEKLLGESINTIRTQLNRRNNEVYEQINTHLKAGTIEDLAKESTLKYALMIGNVRGTVKIDTLYFVPGARFTGSVFDEDFIESALSGDINSVLDKDNRIFENYHNTGDSTIIVLGMPVDSETVNTISNLEQAITSFGLIYLLFIRGNLGYIAAIALVFVLTVIAVRVAWKLSKNITGPIKDLAFGFKKVGEGDLDIIVNTEAKDEIAFLLKSFNIMVEDLRNTQKKLLQSERIAAWQGVARQISHEIKNPLTPIQLSLHRLRKKIHIPEEHSKAVAESFRTIEEEIESLRRIATEFSEFARMPKPSLERGSIIDTLKSTAILFQNNKYKVPVKLELDEIVPESLFDPEQMKRVFINVITNGIDASQDNRLPVIVSCTFSEEQSQLIITISDKGSGMDKETLDRIFDPYFTTKKDGTGLGMSIIKKIIEEHHGSIWVESSPGNGASVTIQLPAESSES